jgi:ATP synthase subunit 6
MNLVGLTPYGFTNTAFLIEPFILSCSILVGLTLLGFAVQGVHFFEHFVPKNIPSKLLVVIVTIVEIISYISRAFSLAIRLFANMMSGHTLLYILASFSVKLSKFSLIIGFIPFLLVLAISFLEFGIAFLQAYVFMILTIIYFNENCPDHSEYEDSVKVFNWISLRIRRLIPKKSRICWDFSL